MSVVNLAASESVRLAANTAITELFEPIEAQQIYESKQRLGILGAIDSSFREYHRALPLAFQRVLASELHVGEPKEVSLLDQREVADRGGIRVGNDFECSSQSVHDTMIFNSDLDPSQVAVTRYRASGTLGFGAECTQLYQNFAFGDDSLVAVKVLRAFRRGKQTSIKDHSFTYSTKEGLLAFRMNIDLLLGDQTDDERADSLMHTFTGLLKIMRSAKAL